MSVLYSYNYSEVKYYSYSLQYYCNTLIPIICRQGLNCTPRVISQQVCNYDQLMMPRLYTVHYKTVHNDNYRALMVILQSHRTQNNVMILRCYPNVAICYTSETYQILSPVLFQQSLYFPLLIHRIFFLLVYIYIDTGLRLIKQPNCFGH